MAKGEIIIKEDFCRGCAFCAMSCKQGCITMSKDQFTSLGYQIPIFSEPENCNACTMCGKMCPHYAIEVYKLVA